MRHSVLWSVFICVNPFVSISPSCSDTKYWTPKESRLPCPQNRQPRLSLSPLRPWTPNSTGWDIPRYVIPFSSGTFNMYSFDNSVQFQEHYFIKVWHNKTHWSQFSFTAMILVMPQWQQHLQNTCWASYRLQTLDAVIWKLIYPTTPHHVYWKNLHFKYCTYKIIVIILQILPQ